MAIEPNNITGLRDRNQGKNKLTLSDSDYVLRDKKKEQKGTNTRNLTGSSNKYADKIAQLKAEARKEVEAELTSSGFIDKIKADIKAEMEADTKQPRKTTNTGGK